MKKVLIAAGGVVGLVALVALIGALLPKGHVASRMARYNQPPGAVWQAITEFEKFPSWRSDVERVERLPGCDGRPGWREVWKNGQNLPLEVVESAENERLVMRIADPNLPFGGTWTYELAPADGGCTLRVTENGEVYNPIFRFMARFVFGYSATLEDYLKALGKKFGEDVQVGP